ncbi:hypothetical protein FBEOM_11362 [Fusarium beomiforme]|uniref:Uncharacterized protein n=1 Tax=Fusarium beomiforme TaxID=44412 RepID=A0A9P5DTG7_9HYPO|nr:hypothetical protein FBEOM_11362 [Fusarium beomiforme]
MVVIHRDSELMTNYVAANPIAASERFDVFTDADNEPGVFALSEDFYLYVIMLIDHKPTKIDFGHISGVVPSGVKVQAFAVVQAPDTTLDICIVTPGAGSTSDFALVHNISPRELNRPIPPSKVIRGSDFPTVDHIFMANKSTDSERMLPLVMVAFESPDRLSKTAELKFVQFDKSASLLPNWDLATNPRKILDVCLGTCKLGDGAFVLYEGLTGTKHVQFKFFTGSNMVVEPHCPSDATCIDSYIDPASGQSVLLVGGQNVTAYTAKDYCSSEGTGTTIDTGDLIHSLKDLHVSQSGETLRFWYTTDADAVHYYTTKSTSISGGTITPILPEGQGERISSMLTVQKGLSGSPLIVSRLISVDENRNLVLLQQDLQSQIWQRYPFWHASTENVMKLRGYMLRMQAVANKEDESYLIPGCWLRISSSGVVRCIANNKHISISPTPQWLQTDTKGVLNIMFQNDDTTCHQFAVDRFRAGSPGSSEGSSEMAIEDLVLDPSKKMIKKLDHVKTAEDIANLQKPDGTPLVSGASPDDLKAAADSISTLVEQAHMFHSNSNSQALPYSNDVSSLDTAPVTPYFSFGDLVDDVTGAWHWVEEKFKDVVTWGCHFITNASGMIKAFVVQIGDKIYNFALKTISIIVKVISWVFKKLGAGLQDVIDFFGFFFNWGDILDTADSISAGFNAALEYGQQLLTQSELNIDSWLEKLRTTIKSQLPDLQKINYVDSEEASKTISSPEDAQSPSDTTQDQVKAGVAYNWTTYHLTYGGGTTNAVLHDDETKGPEDSSEKQILQLWDDVQKEITAIVKMGDYLAGELFDFFISGKLDIQGLMGKISANLVDDMIEQLKILADILFKALSLGISIARDVGNKTIDIPILGWLWKNVVAPGRPLSLLSLCSLLLAIPTTVLYKAKKKMAPPKLKGRLTKDSFCEFASGTADPALVNDISSICLATSSSLEIVYGELETIALLADGAFEGLGLETIPVGPISALMNVVNSASLTFETINCFLNWPVDDIRGNTATVGKVTKYSKWGLTLTNFAANAVANIVGKAEKAEQPVIKRWKGSVAAVISVPMICVALTQDINDLVERTTMTPIIENHFIEAFLKFGKQWGFAVSSWNDEVEDETLYVALAVKQACTYGSYALKIADFVEEDEGYVRWKPT